MQPVGRIAGIAAAALGQAGAASSARGDPPDGASQAVAPLPFRPAVSVPLWQLGMSALEAARVPSPVISVEAGAVLPVPVRQTLGIQTLSYAGRSEQGVLALYG